MTKSQAYYFDGTKSSLLWDEETTAWNYTTGAPETVNSALYRTIPTLYRGINLIADAMTKVPFSVYKGKTEYDISEDWQNKIEFLPNPRKTFLLLSQSLDRHGVAYLLKVRNRGKYVKELKWLAPSTIQPVLDIDQGLTGFKRSIENRTIELPPEDVIYFWLPDSDVEIGPPKSYPLYAALGAAGVLHNLNDFIAKYFERGAIRPTIATIKNMPSKQERIDFDTWLNRMMGGIRNAFKWKSFNAESIDFKQIGDGLDQLQDQTLTADQRQDVSLALGIPQTILFANSANFATSMSDQRNFYDMTIVPRCEFVASVVNEQLLDVDDLSWVFQPDEMDMYQEDESSRAASLAQLTGGSGVPLLMAMDLLGYDLTDKQRAELEAEVIAKEERAAEMAEQLAKKPEPAEPAGEAEPTEEAQAEEKRWKRACLQAFRKSHPLPLDWISESIPPERYEAIVTQLSTATTVETIAGAFQNSAAEFYTPAPEFSDSAITLLAGELKRARLLLEELSDNPTDD